MRHKEDANDYRYFPEPDLQPIIISREYIEKIRKNLPPLPNELFEKFTKKFLLSNYDANILTEEKSIALYYNRLCNYINDYKSAANFINGTIKSYINRNAVEIEKLNINPKEIANLIKLINEGEINHTIAKKIFLEMLNSNKTAKEIATKNNWILESDNHMLNKYLVY